MDKINEIVKTNNDNIIKYLNKEYPNKVTNFPILSSTKKFHKSFLNNILNRFETKNYNLNYFCFKKTLNEIKKNNIIVAPADKNVGIVLLESRIYYDLCKEHLYDKTIYKSISFNPHFHLLNKCKTTLKTLCSNGHISNEIYSKLNSNIENKKLPSARILPK